MDSNKKTTECFVEDVADLSYAIQIFLRKYSTDDKIKFLSEGQTDEWACITSNIWSSANIFFASTLLFERLLNTRSLFSGVNFNTGGDERQ